MRRVAARCSHVPPSAPRARHCSTVREPRRDARRASPHSPAGAPGRRARGPYLPTRAVRKGGGGRSPRTKPAKRVAPHGAWAYCARGLPAYDVNDALPSALPRSPAVPSKPLPSPSHPLLPITVGAARTGPLGPAARRTQGARRCAPARAHREEPQNRRTRTEPARTPAPPGPALGARGKVGSGGGWVGRAGFLEKKQGGEGGGGAPVT